MRENVSFENGWTSFLLGGVGKTEAAAIRLPIMLDRSTAEADSNCTFRLLKNFFVSEDWKDRHIIIECAWVSCPCVWYVNDFCVARSSGKGPIRADITPAVQYSTGNTLTVEVTIPPLSFSSLVEDVTMRLEDDCSIDADSVWYETERTDDNTAICRVHTDIRCNSTYPRRVRLVQSMQTPEGKRIPKQSVSILFEPFSTKSVTTEWVVKSPQMWSDVSPVWYHLTSELAEKDVVCDRIETDVALKTVKADAKKGLLVNGISYKMRGLRENDVRVRRLTPGSLLEYEAALRAEMGLNTIVLPVNELTEKRLEQCDKKGMSAVIELPDIEINETYFETIRSVVARGRRHVSVLMWKIGDTPFPEADDRAAPLIERVASVVAELSPHLPVLCEAGEIKTPSLCPSVGIWGAQYEEKGACETLHAMFPQKPILVFSRTIDAFLNAFHLCTEKSYFCGHIQQLSPAGEEELPIEFSSIRLMCFVRPLFEQIRACYSTGTPVMTLQVRSKNDQVSEAVLVSNCDSTSLWADGRPIGGTVRSKVPDRTVEIDAHYGYLQAVGFRGETEVLRLFREATTVPYAVSLKLLFAPSKAQKNDVLLLLCSAEDSEGREVGYADFPVWLTVRGGAQFDLGGTIAEQAQTRLQMGSAMIPLRRINPVNPITVTANAESILPDEIMIK